MRLVTLGVLQTGLCYLFWFVGGSERGFAHGWQTNFELGSEIQIMGMEPSEMEWKIVFLSFSGTAGNFLTIWAHLEDYFCQNKLVKTAVKPRFPPKWTIFHNFLKLRDLKYGGICTPKLRVWTKDLVFGLTRTYSKFIKKIEDFSIISRRER